MTDGAIDPWLVEPVVVAQRSHTGAERRAISRDVDRGLLERIGPGAYARTADLAALTPEGRHVVLLRARSAASARPLIVSHWSAAVVHGLPAKRSRLSRPHITTEDEAQRHRAGLAGHRFGLASAEIERVRDLLVTSVPRTVIDVSGAAPFDEGVPTADAALARGVSRSVLAAAVDLAGPRQAGRRIADTLAFAHPGAESPAESGTRVTAYRLGVEVPQLQRRIVLDDGREAFLDVYFPIADAALEVDGLGKYRSGDPAATVMAEKRREDQVRARVQGFARCGWAESGSTRLLLPVLERIGVHPRTPRTTFAEWCEAARDARPRRLVPVGRSAAVGRARALPTAADRHS